MWVLSVKLRRLDQILLIWLRQKPCNLVSLPKGQPRFKFPSPIIETIELWKKAKATKSFTTQCLQTDVTIDAIGLGFNYLINEYLNCLFVINDTPICKL